MTADFLFLTFLAVVVCLYLRFFSLINAQRKQDQNFHVYSQTLLYAGKPA